MSLVRIGALRNICDNLAYGGRGRRMDGIVHVKTAAMRDLPSFAWSGPRWRRFR